MLLGLATFDGRLRHCFQLAPVALALAAAKQQASCLTAAFRSSRALILVLQRWVARCSCRPLATPRMSAKERHPEARRSLIAASVNGADATDRGAPWPSALLSLDSSEAQSLRDRNGTWTMLPASCRAASASCRTSVHCCGIPVRKSSCILRLRTTTVIRTAFMEGSQVRHRGGVPAPCTPGVDAATDGLWPDEGEQSRLPEDGWSLPTNLSAPFAPSPILASDKGPAAGRCWQVQQPTPQPRHHNELLLLPGLLRPS
mmetsp:Transcript_37379/g.81964  ORF Transcript_37379/g.81964 Transcript_37379/m.81964 type:complete len:258 (+) Transcript_37379:802-1575(+)